MHSTNIDLQLMSTEIMSTENPQVFSREGFIYFLGKHNDMYYFFSIKKNLKDIFIDGQRRKEQQKESDISKSIEKAKLW